MTKTKAYRKTNTKAQTQTKKNTKYFKDSIYVFLFFFGVGFQAIGLQTNTCESWSGRLCRVPFFGRVEWEERSGKKVKVLST